MTDGPTTHQQLAPEQQLAPVVGTGTPPTSPNFGAPRYSAADPADFPTQANGITDVFDAQAAKRGAIVDADIAVGAAISKGKLAALAIADADVAAAAAIAESKLALATDAAAGVGSRRTLGPGAQQAMAGNDPRVAPVGTVVAYSGTGDPPGGAWLIADGRLVDSTVFASFDATCGRTAAGTQHVYNGGVDPGGNKVKLPDKRGRHSIGALNMGTGATANDNAHAQVGRGGAGGEAQHVLSNGEMPQHSHGGVVVANTIPISVNGGNAAITTNDALGGQLAAQTIQGVSVNSGRAQNGTSGNYTGWFPQSSQTDWGTVGGSHSHTDNGHGHGLSQNPHGHYINNDGASGAHNLLAPFEADSYIVRVA